MVFSIGKQMFLIGKQTIWENVKKEDLTITSLLTFCYDKKDINVGLLRLTRNVLTDTPSFYVFYF